MAQERSSLSQKVLGTSHSIPGVPATPQSVSGCPGDATECLSESQGVPETLQSISVSPRVVPWSYETPDVSGQKTFCWWTFAMCWRIQLITFSKAFSLFTMFLSKACRTLAALTGVQRLSFMSWKWAEKVGGVEKLGDAGENSAHLLAIVRLDLPLTCSTGPDQIIVTRRPFLTDQYAWSQHSLRNHVSVNSNHATTWFVPELTTFRLWTKAQQIPYRPGIQATCRIWCSSGVLKFGGSKAKLSLSGWWVVSNDYFCSDRYHVLKKSTIHQKLSKLTHLFNTSTKIP